jgi:long-chain acyl-CoA synthetase
MQRNLAEHLRRQADRLGPRPALRYKRDGLYRDLSWQDYCDDALACAAALIQHGVAAGDRVGVLSENRLEWLIADMGILAAAAVNVPPHAPLTARQIHFQLRDAGVSWLFVSTAEQLAKVRAIRSELPDLRGVVVFDRHAAAEDAMSWPGFVQRGRNALAERLPEIQRRAPGPDALATIMYTSGTTGNPKGVMLTHDNLISNVEGVLTLEPALPDDLPLNWLPFSHIYARTVDHYKCLIAGTTLALAESADTVLLNLQEIQPTGMNSVPRLYEKVFAAVNNPDPKETGRRLRGVFGMRMRRLSSGGAPLPLPIIEAYAAAGWRVLQGYGLTESSPVISFNSPEHNHPGTVGRPLPNVEIRIAADGEILTRGPHVMKGYWNNPQATAEAIRDGWLHTGDLGRLDADGYLSVTGRKKEMLVLSNGKKVSPTQIEGLLLADPLFDQAVVYGEGRNFLAALVVPNWKGVRSCLAAEAAQADAVLAAHPRVHTLLREHINIALKDPSNAEQVKEFVVLPGPFTLANDEVTVSLKLRRNIIFARHQAALDALYNSHPDRNDAL